ncbi:MAG: hypothetical protein RMK45_10690, partial [Armatimonadota bacterium]|nr:hypothetical protein [Armatimonadota bacterium]
MKTLERRNLGVCVMAGGAVGFLLGLLPPVILDWDVGVGLVTIALGTVLGVGVGVWLGRELNRRFPPMLPFHAREHKRLREVAQRVRENLRQLTGLKGAYPELDTALKHDALLRVQASELRVQLDARASAALNWGDYLAAGIETLRTGGWRELLSVIFDTLKDDDDGAPSSARSEWIWSVYRNKLQREIERTKQRLARAHSDTERNALQHARTAKARELESFHASEHAMRELESASAAIATQIEHLHTETI